MPIDVGQLLGIIVRHVWREAVTILTGSARLGNGYCPRKQPIRTMTAETLLRSPFGPVHYALAIVVVELCAVDNVAARLPSQFPYSLCTLWSPNGCCTMLGPCCVLPVWGRARPCEYHAGSSRVPWGGVLGVTGGQGVLMTLVRTLGVAHSVAQCTPESASAQGRERQPTPDQQSQRRIPCEP